MLLFFFCFFCFFTDDWIAELHAHSSHRKNEWDPPPNSILTLEKDFWTLLDDHLTSSLLCLLQMYVETGLSSKCFLPLLAFTVPPHQILCWTCSSSLKKQKLNIEECGSNNYYALWYSQRYDQCGDNSVSSFCCM